MLLQIIEMLTYSIGALVVIAWVGSMVIPSENEVPARLARALGIGAVLGSLAFGYVLAFEKPIQLDCRPAGPAIFNDC